jgi:DNA-directed RNA polymerase specialized sigma24 family protein
MNEAIEPPAEPLLRRAREGDGPALGQLLESYRAYLVVLARIQVGRRLQGKVDASDVVQEAFLGAHRDFPQFRGSTERELLGWLRGILASLLANLVRHYHGTKRRDVRSGDVGTTPEGYRVTRDLLRDKAKSDAIVLHSLPRMDELPTEVDDTRHARYWAEAFNGVVMRMALLALVLGAME